MATWLTIKAEIQAFLEDGIFQTGGSKESYLLIWANRVVRDICQRLSIPSHYKSAQATLTTANYIWSMPTDFLKISPRFTRFKVADTYINWVDLDVLHSYDPNHSETTTNDYPSAVATEGNNLYVYPKWAGTIVIEDYFRVPTDMALTSDSPDIPDSSVIQDLLINGVCRHGFKWLNELGLMKQCELDFEKYLEQYQLHLTVSQFNRKSVPA